MRAPTDFRTEPLCWTASTQLNIAPLEERPRLTLAKAATRPIDEPYVCLGIHATAQAKYWNHAQGWAHILTALKALGLRVFLASREDSGHMGNTHPPGLERLPDYEIATTAQWIKHARAFVGVGSGLSWLAWSLRVPVVLISGFSEAYTEPRDGVTRIGAPAGVCQGCFNVRRLNAGDWQWCPNHKGTERHFECTKTIMPEVVLGQFKTLLNNL